MYSENGVNLLRSNFDVFGKLYREGISSTSISVASCVSVADDKKLKKRQGRWLIATRLMQLVKFSYQVITLSSGR